jgi:hypothetical protein
MIEGNQFLKEVKNLWPHLGLLIEQTIEGINGMANHLGIDPNGKVAPPAPLQNFQISAGDGQVHAVLTDNSPIKKNAQYFVEYSTEPAFLQPYVEHLGASRQRIITLPALKGDGVTAHTFYFRAYSQYYGSDAQSEQAVWGGKFTPAAVTVGGTSKLDLLPSTGSGTAFADGSQGGQGLGTVLQRSAIGPKRSPAPKAQ